MPRYRAREPIYLNSEGRLIATGEVFSSAEVPGHAWIALETEPVAKADERKPAANVPK
jgi:hypothetical protein